MKQKSSKVLFRTIKTQSKDWIVLNWHDSIEEFGLYAEAYHCAAKKLVSFYGLSGAVRDIESAPILFLYRHAFELYLKAFILGGSKILDSRGKKTMSPKEIFKTHELSDFLPYVEAIINEVGWSWDMGTDGLRKKSDFVDLVKEFSSIYPGAFRYPTRTDGKDSLSKHFSFNLSFFARRMDPLLDVLDGSLLGLEECWNSLVEAYLSEC